MCRSLLQSGIHIVCPCPSRPALYDAYHEIHNLDRLDSSEVTNSHIVGPICESGTVTEDLAP